MVLDEVDSVIVCLMHVILDRIEVGLNVVDECRDGLDQGVDLVVDQWGWDNVRCQSHAFHILLDECGSSSLFIALDPYCHHLVL